MQNLEASLFELLAWALRDSVEVVSGAYKQREVYQGLSNNESRMNEHELLEYSMVRLTQRCHMISNVVDEIKTRNGPQ